MQRSPLTRVLSNHRGFSLIELIVAMVLMSILALMLPNFIANWLGSAALTRNQTELLAQAENALDTINQDIRLSGVADTINRWPDPNAPGLLGYGWTSDSDTLVLAKAATDQSQDIIFSDPAKYFTLKNNQVYYLDGDTLYRRTIASNNPNDAATTTCPPDEATSECPADRTIATGVTNFSITYYDASNIQVIPTNARSIQLAITLEKQHGGKTISANYDTRMVFRNE